MKVAELIAKLQELPPDLEVMGDGYEGGIDLIEEPRVVDIARDVYKEDNHLFGRHVLAKDHDARYEDSSGQGKAVYLPR